MSCGNPSISEQLLAYIDGALPSEDDAIFREHIAACADCQQEVADMQSLTARVGQAYRRQRSQPLAELCPDTEALLHCLEASKPDAAGERVRRHLDVCADCHEQVELLRGIDTELPAVASAVAAPPMSAALKAAFSQAYPGPSAIAPAAPAADGTGTGWTRLSGWSLRSRRAMAMAASVVVICGMSIFFVYNPEHVASPVSPPAVVSSLQGAGGSTPATPAGAAGNAAPAVPSALTGAAHNAAAPPAAPGAGAVGQVAPTAAPAGGLASNDNTEEKVPSARDMHRDSFSPPAPAAKAAATPATRHAKSSVTVIQEVASNNNKASLATVSRVMTPVTPLARPSSKSHVVVASVRPVHRERVASTPRDFEKKSTAGRPQSETHSVPEPAVADTVNRGAAKDEVTREAPVQANSVGQMQNGTQNTNQDVANLDGRKAKAADAKESGYTMAAPVAAPPPATEVAHAEGGAQPRNVSLNPSASGALRGHDDRAADGLRNRLAARGRATVAGLLGNNDFTLRVTVTPNTAAELVEAHSVRVEVVLSSTGQSTAEALKSALLRNLGLSRARGDEVIIYTP